MNERTKHELRRFPWQVQDSGQWLLVAAAGVLLVASVTQTVDDDHRDARVAVAFGVLIGFGELLRLSLPDDRESAPIATAGALGYALLIRVGSARLPQSAMHSAQQVVTVAAIGMIIGAVPHLAVGRPARVGGMAARLLAVAAVAFIFRPLAGTKVIDHYWGVALAVMASLVILALLVEAVLSALMRADEQRARFWVTLVDEMRVQLPLGAAVGASALLISFASEVMGLWALAVFTAPLLVTQVAFRRYSGIRATYLQTVRALAKVTEIGGYVETGHSERVSRLAVAIGRELGIHEPELLELEYAALMHDIGQLSLSDPIPGGATVLVSREDQDRIAELGAEVIQQAKVLGSVAEIVRRQNEPYRDIDFVPNEQVGEAGSPGPPLSSRIIRAANAFDDLVGGSFDPARATEAVHRLQLDTASEFDPRVVEALSRVVHRRSLIQL
ncbi:MAG: HD domain-containing protein [Streptosporangiaceae bacterium]|nr:HD domain-containing protein [Streptosporangiaceae bacterium]